MGACSNNEDRRNKKPKSDMKVVDLRSEKERNTEKNASEPLKKPLENYAQEILALFEEEMSFDSREAKLRKIGEKMNDHDKQMQVAYRANYLCREAYSKGNKNCSEFSMRVLEYAWDGIGGWMK